MPAPAASLSRKGEQWLQKHMPQLLYTKLEGSHSENLIFCSVGFMEPTAIWVTSLVGGSSRCAMKLAHAHKIGT